MIREKSHFTFFTIGFQKPGICAETRKSAQIPGFWNPMVKNVKWDFSLIRKGHLPVFHISSESLSPTSLRGNHSVVNI
jgi:hypothetical protein